MSLTITPEATRFLLARIPLKKFPLRLRTQKKPGCGDVAHSFEFDAKKTDDDFVLEIAPGSHIVCDFYEYPEYKDATIALMTSPQGEISFERIVVVPHGGTLCGCGETARLPDKRV